MPENTVSQEPRKERNSKRVGGQGFRVWRKSWSHSGAGVIDGATHGSPKDSILTRQDVYGARDSILTRQDVNGAIVMVTPETESSKDRMSMQP